MYQLVDGKKIHDIKFNAVTRENYVPAQNKTMIYIGIFMAVIVLLILIFMLYRKLK